MDQLKTILAKFWVAILCAIVALAAVIASFWPLSGYHEELHQKLLTSAGNYTKAHGLMTKPRLKPLAPGQLAPDPLTQFPSPSIIHSGEALRDKLNEQSELAVKAVVDVNTHIPLLPGVLPNPAGVANLDYRNAYNDRLGTKGTLFTVVLHAGLPPTAEDVKEAAAAIWKDKFETQLVADPNNAGKAINYDAVMQQYKMVEAALPQTLRQETSQKFKVYAGLESMPIDPVVSTKNALPPDPRKIWWSQMALWVEEDVAAAIADANKTSTDVTKSSVKRLLKLEFLGPDQAMLFTGPKTTTGGPSPMMMGSADTSTPAPTLAFDPNTPVPSDFKASPSGRISCSMYDVVQFRVEMVVAAKDLAAVMDSFARNRLMAVLNIDALYAEDLIAADTAGFFYGPDRVVHVTFKCEALYLRAWTIPLMPDSIKRVMASTGAPVPQ